MFSVRSQAPIDLECRDIGRRNWYIWKWASRAPRSKQCFVFKFYVLVHIETATSFLLVFENEGKGDVVQLNGLADVIKASHFVPGKKSCRVCSKSYIPNQWFSCHLSRSFASFHYEGSEKMRNVLEISDSKPWSMEHALPFLCSFQERFLDSHMVYAGKMLSSMKTRVPRTKKNSNGSDENTLKRRPVAQNNRSCFELSAVHQKGTENYVHESERCPVVLHRTEIKSITYVTHFGKNVVEDFVVHWCDHKFKNDELTGTFWSTCNIYFSCCAIQNDSSILECESIQSAERYQYNLHAS